jgi:hypothetical protein
MPIRLPGLALREPLRPKPVSGGILGGIGGALFALLADAGAFSVPRGVQSAGFMIGGAVAGVTLGSLAPFFRKRLSAGLAVWFATTLGLLVANRFWREYPEPLSILLGFVQGPAYAGLFGDYRGEATL